MKKVNRLVYWTPRILGIMFILFLMMFSLDVFEPGLTAGEIIMGLFMHNIPALFLLIILIISWKHEIVGGITFILAGLICIFILSWPLIIYLPAFFIGILFMINWFKKNS